MFNHLARIAALSALMTLGTAAHAATSMDLFTFEEGTTTYTWEEASSPTVASTNYNSFHLAAVAGQPGTDLAFYLDNTGIGFTSTTVYFTSSQQLFSGTNSSPTFLLGTTHGFDYDTGYAVATLTISAVSAVPETGAVAMLLSGLGLMGLIARRRKTDQ